MVHPPHSLHLIDAIAARYPNLRLIIDHLGLVRPKLDHEAFAHLPGLLALAKRPNIAVKASAVTASPSARSTWSGSGGRSIG